MRALFSLVFWCYLAVSSLHFFVGALFVWLITLPFDRNKRWLHLYSSVWGYHYIWLWPWWRVTIRGRELLPDGPAVIAPNHQSFADILVLYGLFHPYKWVSKASIFKVPVIGWNMRLNDYVPIRRGDKSSATEMMDHCRRHLRSGASVLLFPEGTRSFDGALRPFKHGAFTLAVEENVPVVPVAVVGTREALPKSGWVLRGACSPQVQVLPPIHPSEVDGDKELLMERVRAAIAEAQSALLAGASE